MQDVFVANRLGNLVLFISRNSIMDSPLPLFFSH